MQAFEWYILTECTLSSGWNVSSCRFACTQLILCTNTEDVIVSLDEPTHSKHCATSFYASCITNIVFVQSMFFFMKLWLCELVVLIHLYTI